MFNLHTFRHLTLIVSILSFTLSATANENVASQPLTSEQVTIEQAYNQPAAEPLIETQAFSQQMNQEPGQETNQQENQTSDQEHNQIKNTATTASKTLEKPPLQVGKHTTSNIDLFSMFSSLVVVIIVIVISAMLIKRFQLVQPINGSLKVVSSLSLGTKERLVVIQAGSKQVVVGVTPSSINLITELDEPIEAVEPNAAKNINFAKLLKRKTT